MFAALRTDLFGEFARPVVMAGGGAGAGARGGGGGPAPATHVKKKFSKEAVELSDTELLVQIRDLLAEGQRSAGGKHES